MTDAVSAPLEFAYWVPNVSGGLAVGTVEARADRGFAYNKRLAQTAERNGFDYALTQARYTAPYGAGSQHESTSFSIALLTATERLKVIASIHPGLWHPAVFAALGATADHVSQGRFAVNVVSGWCKGECTAMGEPWLEHDERYRRSEEFIRAVREIWTEDHAELSGDFYRIRDFSLDPKPIQAPHPRIFQGGDSNAKQTAARVSDTYLLNGGSPEQIGAQVDEVSTLAEAAGHTVDFALNGFMLARPSESEARGVLRDIIEAAEVPAVEGFAGPDSSLADLVQHNDGFRTGLVGTPEQIAEQLMVYKRLGVRTMLLGFLHLQEEIEYFGHEVLPIVRDLERTEGVDISVADSLAVAQ